MKEMELRFFLVPLLLEFLAKIVNLKLPSLKYGLAMEEEAVKTVLQTYKKEHKNSKLKECGFFLDKDLPFIGGSPDKIISCDRYRESCLAVKFHISISYTTPTDLHAKLQYLKSSRDPNNMYLCRNHKYCTQCHLQMGVTNKEQRYFFVWTAYGNINLMKLFSTM